MNQMQLALIAASLLFGRSGAYAQDQDEPESEDPKAEAPAEPQGPTESDFWTIERIDPPEGVILEISGLTSMPDGSVLACTRRGELFRVHGIGTDEVRFETALIGLHEPLGLLPHNDSVYAVQRGELSRLRDTDSDGKFDLIETVCDDWRISGNYHEYNFGPRLDHEGNLWITTNKPFGDQPFGKADWRGYALRITPDGTMIPTCAGLRSPAGVQASPEGQMFYTDNQGEWCGASKLSHLEPGDFHGHPWGAFSTELPLWPYDPITDVPDGERMHEVHETIPSFKLPAVWFPYDKMGRSPAGFVWDKEGALGPFQGQVFVGDQYQASVMRVFLEEVDGHWQGACFPFRKGFGCGIIRLAWHQGALLTGQTARGWGGLGSKQWGLERLVWNGEMPFEIREMRV
ncbi:MAG: glucose/arabinose dehydrogenase, partial [Planctomycetota bacterium]